MSKDIIRVEQYVDGDGAVVAERYSQCCVGEDGVPECPAGLTGAALTEWNRVIAELDGVGLVHLIDGVKLHDHCYQIN